MCMPEKKNCPSKMMNENNYKDNFRNGDIKMYTKEEYEKRIDELKSVAIDHIKYKRPIEAREVASKMTPEDAYIFGLCIGKILQGSKMVPVDKEESK